MRIFVLALLTVLPSLGFAQQASPDAAAAKLAATRTFAAQSLAQLHAGKLEAAMSLLGQATSQPPRILLLQDEHLGPPAAGVFRTLSQRDAVEQFERWREWSLPTKDRPSVRLLTTLVPQDSPPKDFARTLGERPRDSAFPIAEVNGIRGLFSSGWLLVVAAEEIGRLPRLITELEALAQNNVPNAKSLLLLARLIDSRSDAAQLLAELDTLAKKLGSRKQTPNEKIDSIDPVPLVIAAAALRESLRPVCVQIIEAMERETHRQSATVIRQFLRVALATATLKNRAASESDILFRNRLKYWVPGSGQTLFLSTQGAINPVWLTQEDHILHLAGPRNDPLFLRFPLTGSFEFSGEAQTHGTMFTDGCLVYGGLQYQMTGDQIVVYDPDIAHSARRYAPFLQPANGPVFNRMSIRSDQGGAQFVANLHPVWFDKSGAQSSPFLGLRSFGDRRPLFRNLKLTGTPKIPREVRLTVGSDLRGWRSHYFGETQPPFPGVPALPDGAKRPPPHWSMKGGIVDSAKTPERLRQSLISYQRPLLEGEMIKYEFFYQPGELEVHPALGRIAFLLEPDGVRVHWIIDSWREWTGLAIDNAIVEPLNRRGPRTLPLKTDDWNQVTLRRANGVAELSLNGDVIYQRADDVGGLVAPSFGLFRDSSRTGAQVRNVVMSGDWPETLPEDFLANPAVTTGDELSPGVRQAFNEIAGEEFLSTNVTTVRRRAAELPDDERFEFLADWVLPGPDHGFRAEGEFIAAGELSAADKASESLNGSALVSPAFDLLDVAIETKRLAELRDRITAAAVPDESLPRRARLSLLALTLLELGEADAAGEALQKLLTLVNGQQPPNIHDMWPETLVAWRGIQRFWKDDLVAELLSLLRQQRASRATPPRSEPWHAHVTALTGWLQYLVAGGSREPARIPKISRYWVPVSARRAVSQSAGNSETRWYHRDDGALGQISGHSDDYLLFQSPLGGNFEIEGQLNPNGGCGIYSAGENVSLYWKRDSVTVGTFRPAAIKIEPFGSPIVLRSQPARLRAEFRDGVRRIFVNGRVVRETKLDEHSNPWVGFQSRWQSVATIRDARVTGRPDIPETVELATSTQLTGWVPYYGESTAVEGGNWEYIPAEVGSGELLGRRRGFVTGGCGESLLRYQRPLVEDGAVEYDFFYQPGPAAVETHPALDRLAFLLEPDGVRIHSITDGRYNRTELRPDNRIDEPENRRGPAMLPLQTGEWNHMKVAIAGNTVTLTLNDEAIYERVLEPENERTFGLFHFADVSTVRVRNIAMRGDWPKTLPSVSEQGLADPRVAKIDAALPELKSEFVHYFTTDEIPSEFFKLGGQNASRYVRLRPDGVAVDVQSRTEFLNAMLMLRFEIHGDFDIEAAFDNLDLKSAKECSIQLAARLHDNQSNDLRVSRGMAGDGWQFVRGHVSTLGRDGARRSTSAIDNNESTSGRLRLARRGKIAYSLFAEGDSDQFRVVSEIPVTNRKVSIDGMFLLGVAGGSGGRMRATWKNIRVRAEKLMHMPAADSSGQRRLYAMHVPDIKQIREPNIPLWKQYAQARLKQFVLTAEDENGDEFDPVATFIGEARQGPSSNGELVLWTDEVGRPVAIGTTIMQGRLTAAVMGEVDEFHSLHSGPLQMTDAGRSVWDVATSGLNWQPLPDAPQPASTKEELFAQAMALTKRFTAETGARGQPGPMLQDEPLHKFSYESDSGLGGGILMPWSIDSNPEILLALEVHPDNDRKLQWQFAAANYSAYGQFLLLDEQQVWSESPARFGAHISHLGWITANVNLEEGLARVTPAKIDVVHVPKAPFRFLGSPEWSVDGKSVVLDMSQGPSSTTTVMTMKPDGSDLRNLGLGFMPSFSPDGKQVVFSQSGRSIATVNADGSDRKVFAARGWGSKWSPNGKYIAYSDSRNIVLADPKTKETRNMLTDEQSAELSYVYWNFGWSDDSQWIAFKQQARSGEQSIAIASVNSPNEHKIIYTGTAIYEDFDWHPDGTRILFSANDPELKINRLYTVNRDGLSPPRHVPGQPRDWRIYDCDWSPDGRRILFGATAPAVLKEWKP
ncbi:MAG: DUF1583 domain-containing protein [Planctomycetales bacterium]